MTQIKKTTIQLDQGLYDEIMQAAAKAKIYNFSEICRQGLSLWLQNQKTTTEKNNDQ